MVGKFGDGVMAVRDGMAVPFGLWELQTGALDAALCPNLVVLPGTPTKLE